jgi:hypothetical protein
MSLPFARVIRSLLLSDPAVSAALPGGIHPDQIPQEALLPALAYTVSSEPIGTLSSSSPLPGIRFATLSLTAVCHTATQSESVDAAIQAVILANRAHVSLQGSTANRLLYSGMSFDAEFLADGDDESYRKLTATITGFVL